MVLSDIGIESTANYDPFGNLLTGTNDRLGWIGKETDTESDFGNFGVRNYDSELGRFVSCDPLWEEMMQWSPYHYSFDNPVMLKDKTGFVPGNQNDQEFTSGLVSAGGGILTVIGGAFLMALPEPTMLTKIGGGVAISAGITSIGLGFGVMAASLNAEAEGRTVPHVPTSFGGGMGYGIDRASGGNGSTGEAIGGLVETAATTAVGGLATKGAKTTFDLVSAIGKTGSSATAPQFISALSNMNNAIPTFINSQTVLNSTANQNTQTTPSQGGTTPKKVLTDQPNRGNGVTVPRMINPTDS